MGKASRRRHGVKDAKLVPVHVASPSDCASPANPPYGPSQKAFRLQRRHAAHARRRDGLPEYLILDVAAAINPCNTGMRGIRRGGDIAAFVHLQLAPEQGGGGQMADGDEQAIAPPDRGAKPVTVLRMERPVTPLGSGCPAPRPLRCHKGIRSSCWRPTASGWSCRRAGKSRRWIRVTLSAKLVRNRASSTAVLPPPTTATVLAAIKKPSQVAQAETPKPWNRLSLGRPSQLALAPVAMIRASQV